MILLAKHLFFVTFAEYQAQQPTLLVIFTKTSALGLYFSQTLNEIKERAEIPQNVVRKGWKSVWAVEKKTAVMERRRKARYALAER